jgi:hypothetical protein
MYNLQEAYLDVYYDLDEAKEYDVILDYLLDEGYADSYEEAEGLLEEVTDEEFNEIFEELQFKDLTPEKIQRVTNRLKELGPKIKHHSDQSRRNADEFTKREKGNGLGARLKKFFVRTEGPRRRAQEHAKQGKKYMQHAKNIQDALSRTQASRDASLIFRRNQLRQQLKDLGVDPDSKSGNNIRRFNKENFDIYDIILSHLLDEGYTDTIEGAEAIMVSMSEEWREEIVEAYVPYEGTPQEKLRAKQNKLADRWDKPGSEKRFHQMGAVDSKMTNPEQKKYRETVNRQRDLAVKRRGSNP